MQGKLTPDRIAIFTQQACDIASIVWVSFAKKWQYLQKYLKDLAKFSINYRSHLLYVVMTTILYFDKLTNIIKASFDQVLWLS